MIAGPRECKNCKTSFEVLPADIEFYQQMNVPAPTFCSGCRDARRLLWVNRRALYKTDCSSCGTSTISMYPSDSGYVVYCRPCWYSDKWDGTSYARDYDSSRPFFEQFAQLMKVVPRIAIVHYGEVVNCVASNTMVGSKGMYMSFSALESEDCAYSHGIDFSRNSYDCLDVKNLELCYENIDATKNYRSRYVVKTRDSVDSSFLYDCQNSQNCFMSSNQRNKQYMFRNNQLDKVSYEAAMKTVDMASFSVLAKLKEEFGGLIADSLHKYADNTNSLNCNGDKLDSCSAVYDSYNLFDCERVAHCYRLARSVKDTQDVFGGFNSELLYEGVAGADSSRLRFFSFPARTLDAEYIDWCHDSSNLFGCVSLRNKKYCILNKEYGKEDYEALRAKIVEDMTKRGEYGEFFPKEIAPFAYNESVAQEYAPLTKEEALAKGFRWRDPEIKDYVATIKSSDLPESIKDVTDSILSETIGCAHDATCNHSCTKAFRIIPSELAFYRDLNLPLPRLCPNCRHCERLTYRNPFRLWHRACMKPGCKNEFETPYAPERPETVYCESCYQEAVV